MPVVHLGNPAAHAGGDRLPGEGHVTRVVIPDCRTLDQAVRDVTHEDGLWSRHSHADAASWVECDDPELEQALAAEFGCPIGRPDTDTPGSAQ